MKKQVVNKTFAKKAQKKFSRGGTKLLINRMAEHNKA